MTCTELKIDSNVVGLSFAEEGCLGKLPDLTTPGDELGAVWYPLDPNDYADLGADIKTIARNPINASRQQKKGVVTDVDAAGGFTQDLTQTNLQRLMQGYFFADAHEKTTTHPINGAVTNKVTLLDYTASAIVNITSGHETKFMVGHILKTSDNVQTSNNKDNVVISSIAAGALTTGSTFVAETVTAKNKMEIVGYQFGSGVASLEVTGATVVLVRSTGDFEDLDLNVGEWIHVGGEDDTAFSFTDSTNRPGYARIRSITATNLVLDQCNWVVADDAGTAKTIRIYFGKYIRNEKTASLVKRRTYQLERTLGQDADGLQCEYLIGAVPNEFKMMLKTADKLTCDLSFVATDSLLKPGITDLGGDQFRKPGDRTNSLITEDAFNTSSDFRQARLFVHDNNANEPTTLFASVMEASIDINNGAKGLKRIGTIGSFDVNIGDFAVTGSLEVYFQTVLGVKAIRDNADLSFNIILARENAGFVYDMPLLSLGGGKITVKKDEPIMLPLTQTAAENEWGYTLSATYFSYLPNSAMANAV